MWHCLAFFAHAQADKNGRTIFAPACLESCFDLICATVQLPLDAMPCLNHFRSHAPTPMYHFVQCSYNSGSLKLSRFFCTVFVVLHVMVSFSNRCTLAGHVCGRSNRSCGSVACTWKLCLKFFVEILVTSPLAASMTNLYVGHLFFCPRSGN